MRRDIDGAMRRKFILTKGIGFNADKEGLRRRKMLRGNAIGLDIVQINCKVVKKGGKALEEIFGKKEDIEKAEEKAKEEAKEEIKHEKETETNKEDKKRGNE
jgi:hypothetical protein